MLEQYENFANLNVELSTKIEQLKASVTTNACTINDEQLMKKNEKLKEKLDSSQQAYATLLEQYKTFANLNMELSTKIEQLETSANTNNCTINDEH